MATLTFGCCVYVYTTKDNIVISYQAMSIFVDLNLIQNQRIFKLKLFH